VLLHFFLFMDQLLQQFETPVYDRDGESYVVYLWGRSRPGDTWQGWLVFERAGDRRRFSTPVETTQPNGEAVVYWGSGLTATYFDGALQRALNPGGTVEAARPIAPLVARGVDSAARRERLSDIERDMLAWFDRHRSTRALSQTLFDELPYAHADIVRAIEDLEKNGHYLTRRTEEGNDWIFLGEAAR
jgi:hypothetical protein